MKLILTTVLALAIAGPALAQSGGADMKDMPGMAGAPAADESMITASGEGEVKAVDAKAGTVTLHHGPIAALNWPAMTMAFTADPPSLLKDVKVGQKVTFELMQMGEMVTLTAIKPK